MEPMTLKQTLIIKLDMAEEALLFLSIHSLITDSERNKVRQRMKKLIQKEKLHEN